MKKMLADEAYSRLKDGTIRLIDIRSASEFAQISIDGSLLAPLPIIKLQNLNETGPEQKDVVFLCRTGKRTENASQTLLKLFPNAYMLDGGIEAWNNAKFPLRVSKKQSIPLERQILISAGSLVLLGVLGSLLWNPLLYLAGFVGAGLIFAGVSGFCGLGILLSKMPWNKE